MRATYLIVILVIGVASITGATEPGYSLDSNTAFYEGEHFDYVMSPPNGFRMVTYKAKFDGYSFAFVPEEDLYDSAKVLIGVHIYKIRGLSFTEALTSDTIAITKHYGASASLREIDPIPLKTGGSAHAFYFDSRAGFIPNVMIAYFSGETELIVYELVIQPAARKVWAEERFVDAVGQFKALKRAELGQR